MHINYVTNADLCNEIRINLWKIPHDISGVICIPRGGLLCGTIIAEFLHIPVYTVDGFLNGIDLGMGKSSKDVRSLNTGPYLVVDDSISSGRSLKEVYDKLHGLGDFIFCSVVSDVSKTKIFNPDIILCDVPEFRLFELNIFRSGWESRFIFDIDGVLCKDPDYGIDMNEISYLNHIQNVQPLMLLVHPALALCTHRIVKYYEDTSNWLNKNHIYYNTLYMLNIPSIQDKIKLINDPIVTDMKSNVYLKYHPDDAMLFVESSKVEALNIFNKTNRPVLCMETNSIFQS